MWEKKSRGVGTWDQIRVHDHVERLAGCCWSAKASEMERGGSSGKHCNEGREVCRKREIKAKVLASFRAGARVALPLWRGWPGPGGTPIPPVLSKSLDPRDLMAPVYVAIRYILAILEMILRATSHTRLKAHDHCNVRALIGRKGGNRTSLFHTNERSTWSPTWQVVEKRWMVCRNLC